MDLLEFGFVVVFCFVGVGGGFVCFICFGLQTHLVVASLSNGLFSMFLLWAFLAFLVVLATILGWFICWRDLILLDVKLAMVYEEVPWEPMPIHWMF